MLLTGTGKPRVILGTMTFGPDTDSGARQTDLADYNKALDYLQSHGYNEIDTARTYVGGKQEAWTKDARWKERGLTLATKCYPHEPGMHKADSILASLDKSLAELGTDCVDIFYLHAPDRSVPFTETLEAVNRAHKQGKFVQLGLSNFTAFEVAEIVMHCKYNNWVRPTIYQGMYNAITRSIERELIPVCRRYGLDIVVYNPVAGGIFSGKYKSSEVPTEGRYSDAVGRMGGMYRKRYFRDATFDALRVIEPVVQKHNLTLIETALRWMVHHSGLNIKDGGNDGIIIGVSSLQQLEGNLKDVEKGPLPEEVVKVLDEAWLITCPTTPNYWHLDLKYTYDTYESLFGNKA
ncbi:Aldo/keto reductase, partial [Aureobasidium melanogenum]